MATFRLRDLAQLGVITDVPEQDLPVNAWTDALNVRFEQGRISNVGGWDMVSKTSAIADQIPFSVVKAPLQAGHYFYATNKFIYSVFPNVDYDPSNPASLPELRYNVTPVDTSGVAIPAYDVHTDAPATTKVRNYLLSPAKRWTNTKIAGRIVFNAPGYNPICQPNGVYTGKSAFITLPGWGKPVSQGANKDKQLVWRCEAMHTYKDYLLALNMTESTGFTNPEVTANIPTRVRWSNYAFENQVPLDWYEDDETKDGGFVDLMDATSPIIDGLGLRDYFMVYTASETYMFNYVGGASVFQNQKVFHDSGILAQGCVTEYDGQHIVVTADDVIVHDGSQKESIINGIVRDRFLEEVSSVNPKATRVYANPVRKEVWICYPYSPTSAPDPTEFAANRAAIFNFKSKTWTFATVPDIYDASMGELVDTTPPAQWDTGSELLPTDVAFDVADEPFEVTMVSMGDNAFFCASAKKCLLNIDVGNQMWEPNFTDPTGHPTTSTRVSKGYVPRMLERKGIDMDEAVEEYSRVKTWKTLYPQMNGTGDYTFNISGYNRIHGKEYVLKPRSYVVGHDYKVDCFISERFLNLRIETTGDSDWKWAGYDVDYVVEGRR